MFKKEKSDLAWYHPTTSQVSAGSRIIIRIGVKTARPGLPALRLGQ